ncbi:MAG: DUF4153 domain-containing protein [Candidatus Delongbacteria bacterium]|nr:DUF4153 domain-containing protein [Candidatus Delongbacteria bacterium]
MITSIRENLNCPEAVEKLYRCDAKAFSLAFESLYPELAGHPLVEFWKIRLDGERAILTETGTSIQRRDWIILLICCLVACLGVKLPDIFGFNPESTLFYEKNTGLIMALGLSLYSILIRNTTRLSYWVYTLVLFLVPALYINLLPVISTSHSIMLAYFHLPLLMWCVYGLIYIGFDPMTRSGRIDYLRHNGDLAILGAMMVIAGMALTVMTLGLFKAIMVNIENFYMQHIAMCGIVSIPIVAASVLRHFPRITDRIASIIAAIFSPLFLITLVVYLIVFPIVGRDPFNDREFLLVFNLMLMGVMAIIVFSVSETSIFSRQRFNEMVLFLLSLVSLIIDMIALSAIVYRLGEYGFTPNKTAVLGSNLLIFGNLILITIDLYRVNFKSLSIRQVENTIAGYLPVYAVWTLIVVFLFPLIFNFR